MGMSVGRATPRDTRPEALRRYVQLLQGQPPHRRLAQAAALSQTIRTLAVAGIKRRHPDATAGEVRARLAVRLYGRDVARRMFATIPEDAV
jgi:hypothetical protein